MKEVTDKIAIQKILQQEKNVGSKGEMWITLSEQIILVPFELIKVDLEKGLCWFRLLREDESLTQALRKSPQIKCFFPRSGVYSFSSLHSFSGDSNLLKAKIPTILYAKERRGDERFDIDGQLSLKFERTYKVFDISKGGISIILAKTDRFPFGPEDGLLKATLNPFGLEVKVEVTDKLKIRPFIFEKIPYAGHKISFQFLFKQEKEAARWEKLWPKILKFID